MAETDQRQLDNCGSLLSDRQVRRLPEGQTSRAPCYELPGVNGLLECRVVSLVLVGVCFGERRHSAVETIASAEVARDCRRVTGACMCPGKCPAAETGVAGHGRWLHGFHDRGSLAVP